MASLKLAKILCFPEKPLIPQKYQTNKKIAIENKVFPSKDVLGYQAAQGFASTCMGGGHHIAGSLRLTSSLRDE